MAFWTPTPFSTTPYPGPGNVWWRRVLGLNFFSYWTGFSTKTDPTVFALLHQNPLSTQNYARESPSIQHKFKSTNKPIPRGKNRNCCDQRLNYNYTNYTLILPHCHPNLSPCTAALVIPYTNAGWTKTLGKKKATNSRLFLEKDIRDHTLQFPVSYAEFPIPTTDVEMIKSDINEWKNFLSSH